MSHRERSELRPPDAKRSKGVRPVSPAGNSNIPVFERRKMFEQTDGSVASLLTGAEKTGPAIAKRGTRHSRKDIGRTGSFSRNSKKMKAEDGSALFRKQVSSSGLWQRLRNFGHYDIQSMTIEKLATGKALKDQCEPTKKASGASAAHYVGGYLEDRASNDLVAACPMFINEVGGDTDWTADDSRVLVLRKSLSHEKQKRVGSREKLVLDGDIPLKMKHQGPMSRQASEVFQPQSGIHFPFEYIDYGAAFYRNYFLGQGEREVCVCVCVCVSLCVKVMERSSSVL